MMAVGVPGLVVAVLIVLGLVARLVGLVPSGREMTVVDAAALQSEADIVRLVEAGADPNAPGYVRRTRLRAIDAEMTPLEVAAVNRDAHVMELLVSLGARVDDRIYPVLWCVGEQRGSPEVLAFLRSRVPNPPAVDCAR
jgi:hypothetical protein